MPAVTNGKPPAWGEAPDAPPWACAIGSDYALRLWGDQAAAGISGRRFVVLLSYSKVRSPAVSKVMLSSLPSEPGPASMSQ